MIFGSLGLLVVSTVLLGFGIGRSSVTMLVFALVAAVVAALLLLAAYQAHRARLATEAANNGLTPLPVGSAVPAGVPAMAGGGQPIYFVPVMADGQMYAPAPPPGGQPGNGQTASDSGSGAPLVGYDNMTATQLVRLIGSGALSDEQMEAIASYETTHQQRKTVLQALQGVNS